MAAVTIGNDSFVINSISLNSSTMGADFKMEDYELLGNTAKYKISLPTDTTYQVRAWYTDKISRPSEEFRINIIEP